MTAFLSIMNLFDDYVGISSTEYNIFQNLNQKENFRRQRREKND